MQNLQDIFSDCGLDVQRIEPVHGGDINQSYCLFTTIGKYFLKVNDCGKFPFMFKKEAAGLDLLRKFSSLIIPQVIKAGNCNDEQYLLMQWLDKGVAQKDMPEKFGQALAQMHKQPQQYFGFTEDNYIGSLKQINTRHDEWYSFYADCRILPLVKMLFDNGSFTSEDLSNAESLCKELKNIFPAEPPSLLHGDLWSGNFLIHSSGHAAIFDPAVYCGHREMDIAMTKIFGGFDQRFYTAYNEIYPLANGWKQRLSLTQLYPLLVHAVLFGGHYISQTREIMRRFV